MVATVPEAVAEASTTSAPPLLPPPPPVVVPDSRPRVLTAAERRAERRRSLHEAEAVLLPPSTGPPPPPSPAPPPWTAPPAAPAPPPPPLSVGGNTHSEQDRGAARVEQPRTPLKLAPAVAVFRDRSAAVSMALAAAGGLASLPGAMRDTGAHSFSCGERIATGASCAYFEASLRGEQVCAKAPLLFKYPELHGLADGKMVRSILGKAGLSANLMEEVRRFSHVQHPNIVGYRGIILGNVFDTEAPTHLLLELCNGGSLRLAKEAAGGALPEAEVRRYMGEACKGLAYLQSSGVAHRDIKTSSLVLHDGHVKLTDIGGFRKIHWAHHGLRIAAEFTAPEVQAHGWPSGSSPLAHSADVFSLAVCAMDVSGLDVSKSSGLERLAAELARQCPQLGCLLAAVRGPPSRRPRASMLAREMGGEARHVRAFKERQEIVLQEAIDLPGSFWCGARHLRAGARGTVVEVLHDGSAYVHFPSQGDSPEHLERELLPRVLELSSRDGIELLVSELAKAAARLLQHKQYGTDNDDAAEQPATTWWPFGGSSASTSAAEEAASMEALGSLASRSAQNATMIIEAGAVQLLLAVVEEGSTDMQVQALSVLRNLAAYVQNCPTLEAAGAAALALRRIHAEGSEVQDEAAGLIWNLALDHTQGWRADSETLKRLVELLTSGADQVKISAAGALWSLAHIGKVSKTMLGRSGYIAPLVVALSSGDWETSKQAAGALMVLTDGNANNKVLVAEAGGIDALLAMLRAAETADTTPAQELAAAVLRNLAANAANRMAIVEAGGIEVLLGILTSSIDDTLKANVVEVLTNLTYRCAPNKEAISKLCARAGLQDILPSLPDNERLAESPPSDKDGSEASSDHASTRDDRGEKRVEISEACHIFLFDSSSENEHDNVWEASVSDELSERAIRD